MTVKENHIYLALQDTSPRIHSRIGRHPVTLFVNKPKNFDELIYNRKALLKSQEKKCILTQELKSSSVKYNPFNKQTIHTLVAPERYIIQGEQNKHFIF